MNYYLIVTYYELWKDLSCKLFDIISYVIPDVPYNMSLAGLSQELSSQIPEIGSYLIYSVSQDVATVLSFVVIYKLLKLRFWSL